MKKEEQLVAPKQIWISSKGVATLPSSLYRLMGAPSTVTITADAQRHLVRVQPGYGHSVYSRHDKSGERPAPQIALLTALRTAGADEVRAGKHTCHWSRSKGFLEITV